MVTSGRCNIAITPDLLLPALLRLHPETRAVLDRHGLRGCGGAWGPHESIRFFARAHGIGAARGGSANAARRSERQGRCTTAGTAGVVLG